MALFQWLDALPHRWVASAFILKLRLHVHVWLNYWWCLLTVINIRLNLLILFFLLLLLIIFLFNLLSTLWRLLHRIFRVDFWWFVLVILIVKIRFRHDLLLMLQERGRACLENLNWIWLFRLSRLWLFDGHGHGLPSWWALDTHWHCSQVLFLRQPDPLRVSCAALDGFTHNILI